MSWITALKYCVREFGVHFDMEDGFFECPECGEPIYQCDWEDHDDWSMCPICETEWECIE